MLHVLFMQYIYTVKKIFNYGTRHVYNYCTSVHNQGQAGKVHKKKGGQTGMSVLINFTISSSTSGYQQKQLDRIGNGGMSNCMLETLLKLC